ncbi:MAG: hypothetical protein LBS69_09205 [Prevotellaceae bacterium]|jgi:hypothetical protein|nr:hypothetical protein [Prevotellaceae bacterium]
MRKDKVIYKLVVEDILNVAKDRIDRQLTDNEIEQIADKVGDLIDWYDVIWNAMIHSNIK